MPSSVILGRARTPFGKMGGGLSSLDATDLGGTVIEAALDRSGVAPEQVEQVVFGQVLQAGQGQIPSRQAQIKGGIPKEVPSETINKVCASGMRSLGLADQAIRAGATLETLAGLKAIGGPDATHTAGNAPGVNDGAGAIVVASEEWAEKEGKTPLGRILSYGTVADDFPYLAKTPANAAKQALEKIGKNPEDVDLWEINEAFASVALNSVRMLGVDEEKVNVNGGAIALGHPIGASGSRIVGALVPELRRRGGGLGVAAICSGGGQGDAIVVEVNGG